MTFKKIGLGVALLLGVAGLFAVGIRTRHVAPSPKPWLHEEEEGGVEQDAPDKAMEWRMLSWRDEHGNLPKGGLLKALQQREANLRSIKAHASMRPAFSPTWTSVGADNIGGRTLALAINPNNPKLLLAGAAGGGVWRSTDAGATWAVINDWWASLAIGAIVYDPNNANTIYVGTGEATINADAIRGAGMYKSTDGGSTWNLMASTAAFGSVGSIAISPTDSNRILVGTRPGGVFLSTDGGQTWSTVRAALGCYDVRFSKSNPQNALASILDQNASGVYNAVLYSTDGGVHWNASGGASDTDYIGRLQIQYAPSDNNIVYSVQGSSSGTTTVLKSTDGGHNFTSQSTQSWGSQLWYDNYVWVDPTNPSILVAGATDTFASQDGGVTWTQIVYWANNYNDANLPHADQHFIVEDPGYNGTSNRKVYLCNDGGIFVANDIYNATTTSGWTQLNTGYVTTQFYGAAGNGSTGSIIGGTQDNGTQTFTPANQSATLEFGGDGGFAAIDPTDSNYMYGEYVFLTLHRTTNGGPDANWIYQGIGDAYGSANFIAPFILSPNNPNVLWAGGGRLWRSTNAKAATPTWASVRPAGSAVLSAIAEAPGNANIVWVGQNDGGIAMTTNAQAATPTWTTITGLPSRYVGRILIDKDNSNRVYVGLGGFTSNNLWVTNNAGGSWTQITGSGATALPSAPIHGIARHPSDPAQIFVATEVGVYGSTDGGATWSTSAFGPANVCTDEVSFLNGSYTLIAATHGRGIWKTNIPASSGPTLNTISLDNPTVVGGTPVTATVTLTSAAGPSGFQVSVGTTNAAASVSTGTITIPSGQTSGTFTLSTIPVDAKTTGTVTAQTLTDSVTTSLTVTPPTLSSITLVPTSVTGGSPSKATVTLGAAAGPAGVQVMLASDKTFATVPVAVTVPGGSTTGTFNVNTTAVDSQAVANISATFGSQMSAPLTVNPTPLQSLSIAPASILGGKTAVGTVTLASAAGPSGRTIILQSATPSAASVPASVMINGGATSATFTVTTYGVATPTTVAINATDATGTANASITVNPSGLDSISLSPTSVVAGSGGTVTVNLNATAPTGGLVINLKSQSPAVNVPATVTVPAGAVTATTSFSTNGVDVSTTATVTGSANGVNQSATVTVTPATLLGLTVTPSSVAGGTLVSVRVTLNGLAGPSGTKLAVTSDNAAATPPPSVTVPSGTAAITFATPTNGVAMLTTVNLTATLGTQSVSGSFTVSPPSLSGLKINPTTIKGGLATTGTISLNGIAGPGGFRVLVTSSRTMVLPNPGYITVPAGQGSVSFSIPTNKVMAMTPVIVTAAAGNASSSANVILTSGGTGLGGS